MTVRNEDFLFAQEAQSRGFVTEAQIEEAFMLQKRMTEDLKIDERLAVILVKRGWLAEEQAKQVYALIEPEGRQTQIAGYRLVEKIGRGAMGTVYKAIHLNLHRVVAIKILRRELISEKTHVERLKSEASILASLDHPNIVRALDAGESNGFPYVVMEYVEGETLRDRINREGPLSENEALRIARALADALERARRMGVVHRDVKPGNVLMSKRGGEPKLMDLGLAKGPVDLELTQHGATVGTPQFISPEQAEDPRKADTRSDIYSLGATLYAMLTGRPPFKGATLAEILTKVLYEQPTPVRARNQRISPETGYLVERMMLKDPTLRYQTPAQVVDDVDEIVGGRSIIPEGFQGNWEAFLLRRRNKKRMRIAGITAVTLLIAGLGAAMLQDHFEKQDAHRTAQDIQEPAAELAEAENDDSAAEIDRKLDDARRALRRIQEIKSEHGISAPDTQQLEERIKELEGLQRQFQLFAKIEAECNDLLGKFKFNSALKRCLEHQVQHRPQGPVLSASAKLEERIRYNSIITWRGLVRRAESRGASNLAEFVAIWTSLASKDDGILNDEFITPRLPEPRAELDTHRRTARALAKAARDIEREVERLLEAYTPDHVKRAFDAYQAGKLRADLLDDVTALRRVVRALWGPHVHWRKLETLDARDERTGHVTRITNKLERDVDDQFRAQWSDRKQDIDRLEEKHADHAVSEARDMLEKFIRDLERWGMYPEEAFEAKVRLSGLLSRHKIAVQSAESLFERTLSDVLEALRAGDRDGIERSVQRASDDPNAWPRRALIDQLSTASDALEQVFAAAFEYVKTQVDAEPSDVKRRLPNGSVITVQKFRVQSVGGDDRTVVATWGRGSSKSTQTFELERDFPLQQLRNWATKRPIDKQSLLIIDVALVEPVDAAAKDLRPALRDYGRIQAAMAKADYLGVWSKYVDRNYQRLRGLQDERESLAFDNYRAGKALHGEDSWYTAKRKFEAFLDDPFETEAKEKFRESAEQLLRQCNAELENNKLALWLRGFIPKAAPPALDGKKRVEILVNFDDAEQMKNFKHVLGRLELEAGAVVSPDPVTERYLHLLAGEPGLRRGRPLSIESMFDPGYEISLEFSVNLLGGSVVLAFDIDGVQLAIVSADPNFHPAWRIPLSLEQLGKDGKTLVDYYGRGRGIGYHDGPGFGKLWNGDKWHWQDKHQGRHFERWSRQTDPLDGSLKPELFALPPAFRGRIRIVRNVDKLELWVANEPKGVAEPTFQNVYTIQRSEWRKVGSGTQRAGLRMSKGTGLLQILTWTPMIIDDLRLTGAIHPAWRRAQEAKEKTSEVGEKK